MDSSSYVSSSLELHLFFSRIMKEHAFFLRAGFTPAAPAFSEKAEFFQREFESLLSEAVALCDVIAGKGVLTSGEVVTEFTTLAERQTERLTGIPIDKDITCRTQKLNCRSGPCARSPQLCSKVRRLNRIALKLLE